MLYETLVASQEEFGCVVLSTTHLRTGTAHVLCCGNISEKYHTNEGDINMNCLQNVQVIYLNLMHKNVFGLKVTLDD